METSCCVSGARRQGRTEPLEATKACFIASSSPSMFIPLPSTCPSLETRYLSGAMLSSPASMAQSSHSPSAFVLSLMPDQDLAAGVVLPALSFFTSSTLSSCARVVPRSTDCSRSPRRSFHRQAPYRLLPRMRCRCWRRGVESSLMFA